MCVTSAVIRDWTTPYEPQKPGQFQPDVPVPLPNYVPWTQSWPTPDVAKQMLEIIERLEKLDKAVGALNCKLEAKEKAAYKRKLARRAAKASPAP